MELFWSVFSRIRTECGEIRSASPYLIRMRENVDQNNSEYGHFLHSATLANYAKEMHCCYKTILRKSDQIDHVEAEFPFLGFIVTLLYQLSDEIPKSSIKCILKNTIKPN